MVIWYNKYKWYKMGLNSLSDFLRNEMHHISATIKNNKTFLNMSFYSLTDIYL